MKKRKVKKLRLKKQFKILIGVIIVLTIAIVVGINKYKEYLYQQTYEYKLLQVEYSKEEVDLILKNLDNDYIEKLITSVYDKNICLFIKEKYFIKNNLDKYLAYLKKNKNEDISNIVSIINTKRDNDYYTNTKETDLSKDILMLVNKYNYLEREYVPENLVDVSSKYAFKGNKIRQDVLQAFINMADKANEEDIVIVMNSSYRDYGIQENLWQARKISSGVAKADQYAARAGYSEHQSGLAIDIAQYNSKEDDFENTPAFTWLKEHAHEYGFILRYPKDKENITGYSYEAWHYRYVGEEVAKKIYEENITFDEYYAYYIENN